jgi:hypothetical protein
MEKQITGWSWRLGELSMKEFYKLSYVEKLSYINLLEQLPQQERSSGDKIILNQFSKHIPVVKKFLSLEDN